MPELKDCPRCGGKTDSDEWKCEIHCVDCGFWTGEHFDTYEEAVEWWNYQPLVDRLREAVNALS